MDQESIYTQEMVQQAEFILGEYVQYLHTPDRAWDVFYDDMLCEFGYPDTWQSMCELQGTVHCFINLPQFNAVAEKVKFFTGVNLARKLRSWCAGIYNDFWAGDI